MRDVSVRPGRHVFRLSGIGLTLLAATGALSAQRASPAPKTPPAQKTAAPPPALNRANELLPAWLRVRGEFRERVEGFGNAGFIDSRDDVYYLSRVRFNAALTGTRVAAAVQLQDARVAGKTVGPAGAPFRAPFDLRMAYVDVGTATRSLIGRVGRQELAFGDQRLIGPLNWTNAARTFDAARVTITTKAAQVDLFGGSVVRILDGGFDKSGNGNRVAGAHVGSTRIVPKGTVEPYIFWRRDVGVRSEAGPLGSLVQVTTGVRLVGALGARLDYNVEMDAQTGSLGSDSIRAWAGHWQLRGRLPGGKTPHLTGEYNHASGDENPGDGTRGTFDQLYPTGHDKYGLADQVGWRNIRHAPVGFDVTPFAATPITVNYHSYRLAQNRDALYSAGGAALARVAAGATSTSVGQEVDVQVAHPLTPQLGLAAGYAHLFAGPFLKQATPGRSYRGAFVMLTYVFLAAK